MTKQPAIAFWLLPDQPAREIFADIIRRLAAQFDVPVFQPHVTICVVPELRNASFLRSISFPPLELTTRGMKSGNTFTKSFFAQFAKNAAIQELADTILEKSGALGQPPVDPHLSLLYSKTSQESKCELGAEIELPARVCFDQICAVECALPVVNDGDVRAWKVLAQRRLQK